MVLARWIMLGYSLVGLMIGIIWMTTGWTP
jgi:hypothetical protein